MKFLVDEKNMEVLYIFMFVYTDQGQYPSSVSAKRTEIFRRELPLA